MLRGVTGRRTDVIRTPDGRLVPGQYFPHLFKDYPAIRAFQVIQEAPNRVRIKLVLQRPLHREESVDLGAALDTSLGPSAAWSFDLVESIPLTRSGKLQVVVNHCNQTDPDPDPGLGGGG